MHSNQFPPVELGWNTTFLVILQEEGAFFQKYRIQTVLSAVPQRTFFEDEAHFLFFKDLHSSIQEGFPRVPFLSG